MKRMQVLWAALFVCLMALPAGAGWVLVDKDGETTLISDGRMRTISEGTGLVLDGRSGQMTFLDERQRMYAQGTVEEFCGAMTAVFDAMMANVPPEHRAMMEQMKGKGKGGAAPKVKTKKVGSGGAVAGLNTDKYEVHANGKLYEEVWLATDNDLVKEVKHFAPLAKKFSECQASSAMDMENEPESTPEYHELMEKGWELKSVSHSEDMFGDSTEVVSAEKKDIPDSDFKPPTGYRKVSFSELMGSQMRME